MRALILLVILSFNAQYIAAKEIPEADSLLKRFSECYVLTKDYPEAREWFYIQQQSILSKHSVEQVMKYGDAMESGIEKALQEPSSDYLRRSRLSRCITQGLVFSSAGLSIYDLYNEE